MLNVIYKVKGPKWFLKNTNVQLSFLLSKPWERALVKWGCSATLGIRGLKWSKLQMNLPEVSRQFYLNIIIRLHFFFWLQLECKFHVFVVIFIEFMFIQPWHMARAPYWKTWNSYVLFYSGCYWGSFIPAPFDPATCAGAGKRQATLSNKARATAHLPSRCKELI